MIRFARHGDCGAWVSELLPYTAGIVDELCFVKSMYTEAINHDPAITFFQTGSQIAGRPSFGSWLSYGLGSANRNLPTFIVLVSEGQGGQPLYARLWDSGFIDARHQGVRFRSGKDPVLYLSNPDGICGSGRRAMLAKLAALDREQQSLEVVLVNRVFELVARRDPLPQIDAEPGPIAVPHGDHEGWCLLDADAQRRVRREARQREAPPREQQHDRPSRSTHDPLRVYHRPEIDRLRRSATIRRSTTASAGPADHEVVRLKE